MASGRLPFSAVTEGVRVRVNLIPGAGRNRIEGVFVLDDGEAVLKAAVTAQPEGGKANAALIKMLAKAWRLPKTSLNIIVGTANRRKTILVEGKPEAVTQRLNEWIRNEHG